MGASGDLAEAAMILRTGLSPQELDAMPDGLHNALVALINAEGEIAKQQQQEKNG